MTPRDQAERMWRQFSPPPWEFGWFLRMLDRLPSEAEVRMASWDYGHRLALAIKLHDRRVGVLLYEPGSPAVVNGLFPLWWKWRQKRGLPRRLALWLGDLFDERHRRHVPRILCRRHNAPAIPDHHLGNVSAERATQIERGLRRALGLDP